MLMADHEGRLKLVSTICERPHVEEQYRLLVNEGPCRDCYVGDHPVSVADLRTALRRWPRLARPPWKPGSSPLTPCRYAAPGLRWGPWGSLELVPPTWATPIF